MNEDTALSPWDNAELAGVLFAVAPVMLGGIVVRANSGPVRDAWVAHLDGLLAARAMRRVPVTVTDERLLGGLDLAATLDAGRPVAQAGVIETIDGGVMLLAGAERLPAATASIVAAAQETGISGQARSCFGVVALDESVAEEEHVPASLVDRLALIVDLRDVRHGDALPFAVTTEELLEVREQLPQVSVDAATSRALCATAAMLGIDSLRASILAVRTARVAAALAGRTSAAQEDAEVAARLVLAPRATRVPAPPEDPPEPPPPAEPESAREPDPGQQEPQDPDPDAVLDDVILDAAIAAMPPNVFERLMLQPQARQRSQSSGGAGQQQRSMLRGRPAGTRRGMPGRGARLNVIETLRAAAPWQAVRRAQRVSPQGPVVEVRRDDFRIARYKQRSETAIIFAVDASGSQALNRLAETKGAVEQLLAECYVRRDRVGLVAFRGSGADVVLPLTRSLVLAKRRLGGLPGGGGTPLGAGLDAALALAMSAQREGATPVIVVLTDGRANLGRDGQPGREQATADAIDAAQRIRASGVPTLLIDTSPRPRPAAASLADALGAVCLPLPHADSGALADAVRVQANVSRG